MTSPDPTTRIVILWLLGAAGVVLSELRIRNIVLSKGLEFPFFALGSDIIGVRNFLRIIKGESDARKKLRYRWLLIFFFASWAWCLTWVIVLLTSSHAAA